MGSIHSSFSFKSVLHIWRHFHSIFVVIIIHGSHCSHWKVSYIVYIFLFRIFSPVAAIEFFFFHLSYVYAIQIIDHIEVTSLHCLSLKSCYCLLQNIVFRVSEIQAEIVFELWKVDLSFFLLYMQVFIFCLRLVPPPFFIFYFFPLSFIIIVYFYLSFTQHYHSKQSVINRVSRATNLKEGTSLCLEYWLVPLLLTFVTRSTIICSSVLSVLARIRGILKSLLWYWDSE